jgi:EAL domain-containing protein (putative c-di-GMP-specific phosphodiesterase class I)
VHYQPIVSAQTGRVVSCEALVRWRHPEKGLIPPGEFISVAEETGSILEIGNWVLNRACADAALWPSHIRVAVNLSAKQFTLSANLAADIRSALEASGLSPAQLEVEITESTLMSSSNAQSLVAEMRATGIRIALDDFGTGYSSLAYLHRFPIDTVKIDRSFVMNIAERASRAVISSVASLGRALEIEVVVEGIETVDQLDQVLAYDIQLLQGYLFSMPKPVLEIMPLLTGSLIPGGDVRGSHPVELNHASPPKRNRA